MKGYVNCRAFVVFLAVGMLAGGVASAQYSADFEDPPFTGSSEGVDIWGQDEFYDPAPSGSETITAYVYTYLDNVLEVVDNPAGGGEQFVAGRGPGTAYSRAQRDIDWGGTGIVVVTYDVLTRFLPDDPNVAAANNVGSFSMNPPAPSTSYGYIHLFSWVTGQEGVLWNAWYMMYTAAGSADGAPGRSPGPEWENLTLNNWYRCTTVIDFDANKVIEVSITDLHTGASATVDVSAEGYYLEGGEAGGLPVPTGFRFFAGGGADGNTVAWDNLYIGPAAEPCPGDVDGDGDTDLADLGALLAVYGGYDPACDFDGDGDVDLADLAYLLSDYGCVP